MHASRRASLAGLVIATVLALSACRDATAPEAELLLRVSPDTIRLDPVSGMAAVLYTIQNSGDSELQAESRTSLQSESPPGVWRTIMDVVPVPFNNNLGIPVPPNFTSERGAQLRLNPGRYRLQNSYRSAPAAESDSSFPLEAFSNVFVVLAP
jgi:hypothetical protein